MRGKGPRENLTSRPDVEVACGRAGRHGAAERVPAAPNAAMPFNLQQREGRDSDGGNREENGSGDDGSARDFDVVAAWWGVARGATW